jgi:hypothetical protein
VRDHGNHAAHLALAAVAVFLVLATHTRVGGWNDASRLAMVEAIVERGHLWIDGTHMSRFTGDIVRIDGRFYSDKPPALAFAAVPVYALQVALGSTFRKNLPETYYWTTLLTVGLTTLLGLVFLERFLRRFVPDARWRAATVLGLGLGTLNTAYSVTFSNHPPSATALLAGFLLAWRWRRSGGPLVVAALAGLAIGVAALTDHAAVLYAPAILAYLVWPRTRRHAAAGLAFAVAVALLLAAYAAYAIALSGNPRPLPLQPALFQYPGSYFADPAHLPGRGFGHASWKALLEYSALCLIGYRGLFTITPTLLLVFAGMLRIAGSRTHPRRAEALVALVPTLGVIAYYLVTSTEAGGNAYGVRWFCLFIPLFYVFLVDAYRTIGSAVGRALFWTAYAVSIPLALVGAIDPWLDPTPYGTGFAWVLVLRSRGWL